MPHQQFQHKYTQINTYTYSKKKKKNDNKKKQQWGGFNLIQKNKSKRIMMFSVSCATNIVKYTAGAMRANLNHLILIENF